MRHVAQVHDAPRLDAQIPAARTYLRIAFVERGREDIGPVLRRVRGNVLGKSPEADEIADRRIAVVTGEVQRHQDRIVSSEKVLWHDADDAMRLVIEQNRRANYRCRAAEPSDPHVVSQNGHAFVARATVARTEYPTEVRQGTEHREQTGRYGVAEDALRL